MTDLVELGKSGIKVPPIAFGANYVGGHNMYGEVDEAAGKQLIRDAIDSGVKLIDAAYSYGSNVRRF